MRTFATKFGAASARRYIDKDAVAERYGVSVHTVTAWTRSGYIPTLRCGRLIRFDLVALDEWDRERAEAGRTHLTPKVMS